MCIVAPKELEKRVKNSKIRELSNFTWILTHSDCPFTEVIEDLFKNYDFRPDKYLIANQESIINSLVKSGSGISVTLKKEAQTSAQNNEIFMLEEPALFIDLSLVYLKEYQDDPLIKSVVKCIKECWEIKEDSSN